MKSSRLPTASQCAWDRWALLGRIMPRGFYRRDRVSGYPGRCRRGATEPDSHRIRATQKSGVTMRSRNVARSRKCRRFSARFGCRMT